jgi:hypothetical protein
MTTSMVRVGKGLRRWAVRLDPWLADRHSHAAILHVCSALALLSVPTLVTTGSAVLGYKKSLFDSIPTGGDELSYWHQIATFSAVGWNGGYYAWGEMIASPPFRFSVHGPGFMLVYGSIGQVVGWHWWSGPIFNLIFLALATAVCVWAVRGSMLQMALITLLVVSTWPLFVFVVSTTQEAFHAAVAIAFVGLLYRLLQGEHTRWFTLGPAAGLLTLMCVVRPTWAFLWLPLVAAASLRRSLLIRLLGVVLAAVSITFFFWVWRAISAPFPWGWGPLDHWAAGVFGTGSADGLNYLVGRVTRSPAKLFDPGRLDVLRPWFLFVWEVLLLTLATVVLSVVGLLRQLLAWRARRYGHAAAEQRLLIDITCAWLLLLSVINAVVIYAVELDAQARILLAPAVLAVALYIVARQRRAIVGLFLLANFVLVALVNPVAHIGADLTGNSTELEEFGHVLGAHVRYDSAADPWCNTMLISDYGRYVPAIPPGIGLGYLFTPDLVGTPPRARWILADEKWAEILAQRTDLHFLDTTAAGGLYVNRLAACPDV